MLHVLISPARIPSLIFLGAFIAACSDGNQGPHDLAHELLGSGGSLVPSGGTDASGGDQPIASGGTLASGGSDGSGGSSQTEGTGGNEQTGGTDSVGAGVGGSQNPPRSGPLRIMPLGDSITEASCRYRSVLEKKLTDAGHHDFDFVGSRTGACGNGEDGDHEGHGGILVTNVTTPSSNPGDPSDPGLAQLQSWVSDHPADVVLLHFATNDIWSQRSPEQILAAYDIIVDLLREANPAVIVLAARLIPMAPTGTDCGGPSCPARIASLNTAIDAWAPARSSSESRIVVVNQNAGFDVANDTGDGVHPNETGGQKMANRWFDALIPLF